VSSADLTLCVASQQVIPKVSVYFVMTQSGNFWIHLRISYISGDNAEMSPIDETMQISWINWHL
jgi:hypothetical protein